MEGPLLPVEGASRVPRKRVQGMVRIGGVKPMHDQLARVGPIVAVGIFQEHQVGHLREVDAPVAQLDADGKMEPVGEGRAAVGLPVVVGIFEDQDLVVRFGPRQIHRVRRHGSHPEPPLGVEGHRNRVFEVGKLDLGSEQIDGIALRESESLLLLFGGRDMDGPLDVGHDLDELAGIAVINGGRHALALGDLPDAFFAVANHLA